MGLNHVPCRSRRIGDDGAAALGEALKSNNNVEELALVENEPAVVQAYSVSGETDVVLMLRLSGMEEFDGLCERLFRNETNVARFYTMFVIRTGKETTAIRLAP